MESFRAFAFCLLFSVAVASYDYVKEMQVVKVPGQLGGDPSFTATNCNKTMAPVYVTGMKIYPDVVHLGKVTLLTAVVQVLEDIQKSSDIEAVLEIKMKIGDKFKDMCELLGSAVCNQKDLCSKLEKFANKCPKIITDQGSNCECPFKKNTYQVKEVPIPLPDFGFEVDGAFDVTIHLVQSGRELMCLDLKFCIEHC